MTPTGNIAYADCFSGISGDMFLGALLHLGLPQHVLQESLGHLKIDGYNVSATAENRHGIGCIKVNVTADENQQFRHLSNIRQILEDSSLDADVISMSLQVFSEIARAEAKVHDIDIEHVHFHEVGAIDAIVDVVGVIAGLHYLGIENLYCAAVPSPQGFVSCAHGILPLPAPAVCEILKDVPCYGTDIRQELVTPTGAALIKTLSCQFGAMPPMTITSTGYGAGSHKLSNGQPNLFRLIVGKPARPAEEQRVEVIETNLDDWTPESFPHLCERLFTDGALDVSLNPILMKKGRPGYTLRVIAPVLYAQTIKNTIFTETTSIGLRSRIETRQTLPRRVVEIATAWGNVKAKSVTTPTGNRVYPEYEECLKIAKKHGVPLLQVYNAIHKENQ